MTRSSVRGPGSNQHQDKPPLAPTEATAFVSASATTLADPFADEADAPGFVAPGAWIEDLDTHNASVFAKQERVIADAERRATEAQTRIDAAAATIKAVQAERGASSRVLRGEIDSARKDFYEARNDVTDMVAAKAAELGIDERWKANAEAKAHIQTDPSAGMFEVARRVCGDPGTFKGFERPEWDPRSNFSEDDWNTLVDHISSKGTRPDTPGGRLLRSAGSYQAAESALAGMDTAQESAEARSRFGYRDRVVATNDASNARNRLDWMRRNAERGLPADMRTVETDNPDGLRRHAVIEPDGGTNAYVMRPNGGMQRVVRFEPAGAANPEFGDRVDSAKSTVAVLDDGSRFASAVRTTSRQRFGRTETLWFSPPAPGARPATHPDGSPLGSMHSRISGTNWD